MLVLTRKKQEQIQIGDNVTITIVRIKGNTVRVGIEAPDDVRVARGELVAKDATACQSVEVATADATATNSEEEAEGTADGLGVLPADRAVAAERLEMSSERVGPTTAHAV